MVRKTKKKKSKKRDEAALKKTRLQFQMFNAEVVETEIILEDCIGDFNERFETGRKSTIVEPSPSTDMEASSRSFEEQQEKKEKEKEKNKEEHKEILPKDKDLRDLFRKIAILTHPDKLKDVDETETEYLTELYKDAANAAELGDGMALLEIAYELNIRVDINPKKEIKWLNRKIEILQESIGEMKNTAEWIWGHSDGSEKERIEEMIKTQLGFQVKTTPGGMSDE